MQIYNPFTQQAELIPSKKGSLLIFPRSWMYPVCQDRIMVGDKIVVSGTLSIYGKSFEKVKSEPSEGSDVGSDKVSKSVIFYSSRGVSGVRTSRHDKLGNI
jgi:hypothetical protein